MYYLLYTVRYESSIDYAEIEYHVGGWHLNELNGAQSIMPLLFHRRLALVVREAW